MRAATRVVPPQDAGAVLAQFLKRTSVTESARQGQTQSRADRQPIKGETK